MINASNLRVGGGVQVAVSFISELSKMSEVAANFDVVVSVCVSDNLKRVGFDSSVFASFVVADSYGVRSIFGSLSRSFGSYDLVFTVFGPLYSLTRPKISMVGFAQAWIVYPETEAYCLMAWYSRVKTKLKFLVQRFLFARSDHLVVELGHVRERLIELGISKSENISVVANCVSGIYLGADFDRSLGGVDFVKRDGALAIGFVGRDYLHKNTDIFPEVRRILKESYSLDVDFFVTFTETEWLSKGAGFKSSVINVGELSVAQCPNFYQQMDAVIFPSLLECFSATPLEALAMGRPLFASDRGFVRDVCGPHANYFDPLDPVSVAESIHTYFSGEAVYDPARLEAARLHAINFSSAQSRAAQYVKLIEMLVGESMGQVQI